MEEIGSSEFILSQFSFFSFLKTWIFLSFFPLGADGWVGHDWTRKAKTGMRMWNPTNEMDIHLLKWPIGFSWPNDVGPGPLHKTWFTELSLSKFTTCQIQWCRKVPFEHNGAKGFLMRERTYNPTPVPPPAKKPCVHPWLLYAFVTIMKKNPCI